MKRIFPSSHTQNITSLRRNVLIQSVNDWIWIICSSFHEILRETEHFKTDEREREREDVRGNDVASSLSDDFEHRFLLLKFRFTKLELF